MKKILFFIFTFIIPFGGTPYINFMIGPINISILDIIIFFMFFLIFIDGTIFRFKLSPFIKKTYILLSLIISTSIFSFYYIEFLPDIYDLKMTLNFIEYTMIFFVTFSFIKEISFIKRIIKIYLIITLIFCILTLFKSSGIPISGYVRGVTIQIGPFIIGVSALINAIMTFSCIIIGVFPIVLDDPIIKNKIIRFSSIFLLIITAIILFTRSLWLALSVQLFIFIILKSMTLKTLGIKTIYAIFSFILVALLIYLAHDIYSYLVNVRSFTVEQRFIDYYRGIRIIFSDPIYFLFGYGKSLFITGAKSEMVPHNFVLDMLISKGFITLMIVCFLLWDITLKLIRIMKHYNSLLIYEKAKIALSFIVIIFGYFALGLSTPITNSLEYWFFLSIAASFISIAQKDLKKKGIDNL